MAHTAGGAATGGSLDGALIARAVRTRVVNRMVWNSNFLASQSLQEDLTMMSALCCGDGNRRRLTRSFVFRFSVVSFSRFFFNGERAAFLQRRMGRAGGVDALVACCYKRDVACRCAC